MFIYASREIRHDFLQPYKCAMMLHQEGLKKPDMQLEELTGYWYYQQLLLLMNTAY